MLVNIFVSTFSAFALVPELVETSHVILLDEGLAKWVCAVSFAISFVRVSRLEGGFDSIGR